MTDSAGLGAHGKYDAVASELKSARNVAIFMHVNPDGDCVSSAAALHLFLKNVGKKSAFFSPDLKTSDMIPEKFDFFPRISEINRVEDPDFDLAVAVDTADAGRLGRVALRKFLSIPRSVVIDHHASGSDFGALSLRESGAASATQVLYKLLAAWDRSGIDRDVATLLFAGLASDSGGFAFESCTAESFRIASELVEFGIDNCGICKKLLSETSLNVFRLKNRVLSDAKFYADNRIGAISFRLSDFAETETRSLNTDSIVNCVRDIQGVDIAVSIAETRPQCYKVSFRTSERVSAIECAKRFGGGGHIRASGCQASGDFDKTYAEIIGAMREILADAPR